MAADAAPSRTSGRFQSELETPLHSVDLSQLGLYTIPDNIGQAKDLDALSNVSDFPVTPRYTLEVNNEPTALEPPGSVPADAAASPRLEQSLDQGTDVAPEKLSVRMTATPARSSDVPGKRPSTAEQGKQRPSKELSTRSDHSSRPASLASQKVLATSDSFELLERMKNLERANECSTYDVTDRRARYARFTEYISRNGRAPAPPRPIDLLELPALTSQGTFSVTLEDLLLFPIPTIDFKKVKLAKGFKPPGYQNADGGAWQLYVLLSYHNSTAPVREVLRQLLKPVLRLRHHPLPPLQWDIIGRTLRENTIIDSVDLRGSSIRPAAARSLASALLDNLFISALYLCDNEVGAGGTRAVRCMLERNTSLRLLDMAHNQLTSTEMGKFFASVAKNVQLESLSLADNRLCDKIAENVMAMLRANTSLRELDLSENELTSRALPILGKALKFNSALECLNISGAHFASEASMRLFVRAIKANDSTRLRTLGFSNTCLTDGGLKWLSKLFLGDEQRVECLLLDDNTKVSIDGWRAFFKTLNRPPTSLRHLSLFGIYRTEEFMSLVQATRTKNPDMVIFVDWFEQAAPTIKDTAYISLTRSAQRVNHLPDVMAEIIKDPFWATACLNKPGCILSHHFNEIFYLHRVFLPSRLLADMWEEIDWNREGMARSEDLARYVDSVRFQPLQAEYIVAKPAWRILKKKWDCADRLAAAEKRRLAAAEAHARWLADNPPPPPPPKQKKTKAKKKPKKETSEAASAFGDPDALASALAALAATTKSGTVAAAV